MCRARRCRLNSRSLNAVLMATLALALSTSALGVECAAFRDGIDNLHRAGQRALVWRQAWADAEGRGEYTKGIRLSSTIRSTTTRTDALSAACRITSQTSFRTSTKPTPNR